MLSHTALNKLIDHAMCRFTPVAFHASFLFYDKKLTFYLLVNIAIGVYGSFLKKYFEIVGLHGLFRRGDECARSSGDH